jgi:hypothetical protein
LFGREGFTGASEMVGGGASDVLHFCEKIEDTTGEL